MKVDFKKAFTYPVQEAGAWFKLCVLTIMLVLFPFLFGYVVDVQKSVGEGDDKRLPNIDDWGGYLYRGVMVCLIIFIFSVIPVGMLVTSFGAGLIGMLTSAHSGGVVGAISGLGMGIMGIFMTGIVFVVLWTILPMCILRFATSGSVGSAFDFGGVLSDMLKAPLDYAVILISIPVLHQLVCYVLSLAMGVGWLLLLPAMAYLSVVMANLMGQYYALYLSPEAGGQGADSAL